MVNKPEKFKLKTASDCWENCEEKFNGLLFYAALCMIHLLTLIIAAMHQTQLLEGT